MKILMVSELVLPVRGGLEFYVASLSAELIARGHDVRIATLTSDPDPQSAHVYSLPNVTRLLPHEDARRPFSLPLPDPVARRALGAVIDDFRPDVIHGHNWLAASLPGGSRRPPLILTLHDYSLVCALRTLYDSHAEICSGPAPVKCARCASSALGTARGLTLAVSTYAGRRWLRPDSVIAVSAAVADAVRPHLHTPVTVIQNFNARDQQREALPPGFPTGDYILFAGDAGPHKGLSDLLRAWAQRPVAGATLVVATTRSHDIPDVPGVFRTSLTGAQMPSAWAGAKLGIVPSKWPEPSGTVVLEAYRAGVPVVATRVGGLQDLVDDGRSGILVTPGDFDALSAAIHTVMADPELRERMGERARAESRRYSVEPLLDSILDVYEDALLRRAATLA